MMDDQPRISQIATQPLLDRANQEPPHWADEKILGWDETEFQRMKPFITATYWCGQESINVHHVVGTQHLEYQDMSWLEFFNVGKRMEVNLNFHQSNPGYYLGTEPKKPAMHYVTLDGINYYISSNGNRRTCIAKFDFHYSGRTMLHGVNVLHHQVDRAFYEHYLGLTGYARAHKLPLHFTPQSTVVSREDTGGWKLDRYQPQLQVQDILKNTTEILNREQTLVMLSRLRAEHGRFRLWPWSR